MSLTPDGRHGSLLELARAAGREATAVHLLNLGAPDLADHMGWSGIHVAAEKGWLSFAEALLDLGCSPDLPSRKAVPISALHIAVRFGHEPMIRLLARRGATVDLSLGHDQPDASAVDLRAPLATAIYPWTASVFEALLEEGANPHQVNPFGEGLAHAVIRGKANGNDCSVLKRLRALGVNLSLRNQDGLTALDCALQDPTYNLPGAHTLIAMGVQVSPGAPSSDDHPAARISPLKAALSVRDPELVHERLQQGDDVHALGEDGMDALVFARDHSDEPCRSLLRSWLARVSAQQALDDMALGRDPSVR